MKNLISILVQLVFIMTANSQTNFNKMWIVGGGNNFTVDFNLAPPAINVIDTSFSFYYHAGSSSICNTNGRLILMSTGCNILDSNRNNIEGGDSIGGRQYIINEYGFSSYSQSSIILPFGNGIYYLVAGTVSDSEVILWGGTHDAVFDILIYNQIDMNQNGGLGKVVKREVPLMENVTLSKTQMMASKHANGKDWWLLKQSRGANKIYKFLFTKDSVFDYGVQTFPEPVFSWYDQSGQSMFSMDGTKYASTCRGTGKVFLADFDRCTGMLSNPKVYNVPEQSTHNPFDAAEKENFTQGLSFSPNGQYLYVSMYFNIMQLDLMDNDSLTAWYHITGLDTTWNAFQVYNCMYLGDDTKLYIGNYSGLSKQMSVINTPDMKGASCNFCPRCLRFQKNGVNNPPCMPNYNLGALVPCWPLSSNEILDKSSEIEVYPNPASTIFYIETSLKSKRELYNALGQLIISTDKNEIDVSKLSKGVFYLKVSNQVKKIIFE